jgi:hypothetical protein
MNDDFLHCVSICNKDSTHIAFVITRLSCGRRLAIPESALLSATFSRASAKRPENGLIVWISPFQMSDPVSTPSKSQHAVRITALLLTPCRSYRSRVYHFSPPYKLPPGFLDPARGGRLHLLIRNGPLRRPVERYSRLWIAARGRGHLKEPVRVARKIRGGLLCQSAHINRANAGVPRRTVFACA